MFMDFDGAHVTRFMSRYTDRYCYLGGDSSSNQQQQQQQASTSSNTIDPAEMAMYQQNYGTAQTAANSLTPYTGQLTAGFTPAQTQAQGILSGIATDPSYTAGNTNAINSVSGVLANPGNTTVTPSPVAASTIAGTDLSPYENPYTSDVINATNTQIAQQRGQAQVADNAKATAAGAFGGSRSGVNNALTNQYYDQDTAATDAGLNQANFSQAQSAAAADAATKNNMGQFNSNQGLTAQQDSINNKLAKNGLTVNAAGQVVALNNAALGDATAQAGILSSVGDAQQAQQQTELANAYQAYMAGQQLTVTQQQLLNSALGLVPVQQTVASSGSGSGTTNTQTQTNPGLGGILGGLGSLAQGAAMFA